MNSIFFSRVVPAAKQLLPESGLEIRFIWASSRIANDRISSRSPLEIA